MDKNNESSAVLARVSNLVESQAILCISKALTDDKNSFLADFRPATTNALPHLIGDFINTNIEEAIKSIKFGEGVELIPFTRSGWNGRIIVDHQNKMLYNIMKGTRLEQLQQDGPHDNPHYAFTLSYSFNRAFKAPKTQITFFEGEYASLFSDTRIEYDLSQIAQGQLMNLEGYNYSVITYTLESHRLIDVSAVLLDENLMEVDRKPFNITPNFEDLTQPEYLVVNSEAKSSSSLIKPKKKQKETELFESDIRPVEAETEVAPVALREQKKQA